MPSRELIDRELQTLRDAMNTAHRASMRVFDLTMRLHGVPKAERDETIAAEEIFNFNRFRDVLAECEATLIREGETLQ